MRIPIPLWLGKTMKNVLCAARYAQIFYLHLSCNLNIFFLQKVKVLIKHMINQHHEEELKHECQVCKKVTPGVLPYLAAKENLTKKHFYFCVKKFISGSHLSRHSRIHNGIQPNRQCMICYKVKVLVLEPCIIIHFHSSSITWFYFKIVF